jgi:endonuclease/exonuclease/phosphatase family metal-dependent hydrolase
MVPENSPRTLRVMTRNLYLGTDLAPVVAAHDATTLAQAVAQVFSEVAAANPPERLSAIADEIARESPDLVGLQEAQLWRTQPGVADGPATPAETVVYDYLAILLDALAERGIGYHVIVVSTNYDVEAPGLFPAPVGLMDVRLTDRDAILARNLTEASHIALGNAQSRAYETNHVLPVLNGPLSVVHGWAAVDVNADGSSFRFLSTHLDPYSEVARVAQVHELMAGPGSGPFPLLFVGDFNSKAAPPPIGSAYAALLAAGFADAWTELRADDPGLTCCQAADLRNTESTLDRRVEFVLTRGGVKASSIKRIGHERDARTPSGLWPTDHAGLVATIVLPG